MNLPTLHPFALRRRALLAAAVLVVAAGAFRPAHAQSGVPGAPPPGMSAARPPRPEQAAHAARPWASNVILPQARAFDVAARGAVSIQRVTAGVVIIEQAATTTMEIEVLNPTGARLESELIVPVPDGAVVRGFDFQGAGAEPSAALLPREEARRIYDDIVAKVRDPALLEFYGYNLVRSSVFPVEARATQKVRLTYENLLPADGGRVDYLLPRSESLAYAVPWRIAVRVNAAKPIGAVYSPSHEITITRGAPGAVTVKLADAAAGEPGPFRLSYVRDQGEAFATLFAYPDPRVGGGYFLLLAGLPPRAKEAKSAPAMRREVTLVLDRSGSMAGEKMDQVKEAARQVIGGLDEAETFNVIVYNEAVDLFSAAPLPKTKENERRAFDYLASLTPRGGTNIHDALLEALRQKPTPGALPLVIFLTDGLPTMGPTSEAVIRDLAAKANPHRRRVFTFGVGVDVNTPLLERIASDTRATSSYVLPKENVEVKVGALFRRLSGPVLAEPALAAVDDQGGPAPARVREVLPARLPDLFDGDQLVVLGTYVGDAPLAFSLAGTGAEGPRTFKFRFPLDKATTRNGFVARLWASRKIADLIDAVRALGADVPPAAAAFAGRAQAPRGRPVINPGAMPPAPSPDPRVRELTAEIVRLSTEFGILSEYTAFLAREGTDLTRRDAVMAQALDNVQKRAVETRSGLGSVNQEANNVSQKAQVFLNGKNGYWNEKMERVSVSGVQQVADRAFFNRGGRWIDSRAVEKNEAEQPARVVEFGSDEFHRLAERLANEGRQGCIAFAGDVLLVVDGQTVLVKMPK
ncbi:MAG: VWA domain-containing protein [Planctomycetes bacterium]|nr:VWA domain-containing protein [Planctomycetota bacterium]